MLFSHFRITYKNEREHRYHNSLMNPVNMEVKLTRALPPISKKTTDIDVVMSMNQIVVSTILCAILVNKTHSFM